MRGSYTLVDGLPVIDLAQISQEDEYLFPVVKAILEAQYDTFLLRNYANRNTIDTLCTELSDLDQSQGKDFSYPGFDENFTGKWPLGNSVYVEQYIVPVNDGLPFTVSQQLRRLYTLLFKVAEFFSNLCITAKSELKLSSSSSSQEQRQEQQQRQEDRLSEGCAVKLTRYCRLFENEYDDGDDGTDYGDLLPTAVLPNGDKIESITLHDYTPHRVPGLISVFASGSGIQYRATYSSGTGRGAEDWCSIPEELRDCLVLHLGSQVRDELNNSRRTPIFSHTISPTLRIDLQAGNIVELNLLPTLESGNNADELLGVLMEEFPQVAEKFYSEELHLSHLRNRVDFYKRMFAAFEAVVSLNMVTTGVSSRLPIDKLLPQVTNMLKDRRVTEQDFFRMLYLWPESYRIERGLQTYRTSQRKWTISLPVSLGPLSKDGVGSTSRKSHYNQLADLWYDSVSQPEPSSGSHSIPEDVPLLQLTDQEDRRNRKEVENSGQFEAKHKDSNKGRGKNYLSNDGEQFLRKERRTDTQENLLKRIRAKEQRQNQMLVERELRYQHFLDVKIEEVFNILNALEADKPYTETYISGLIVDSLLDSNNPIGQEEACEVLSKLYSLLSDDITLHTVDGGLKVYRWKKLDLKKFMLCMAKHISETESMEVD